MHPVVRVFPSPAEAAAACASLIAGALREADAAGRPYAICLSGAPAWKAVYFLLAKQGGLPWHRAEFYWGDEVYAVLLNKDSNFRAARDILFAPLGIPDAAVHPITAAGKDPEADARRYETLLRSRWPKEAAPGFDIVLLGTRHAPAHEGGRWVGVTRDTGARILLTPLALSAARRKLAFEVGEDGAAATVSIHDAEEKDHI